VDGGGGGDIEERSDLATAQGWPGDRHSAMVVMLCSNGGGAVEGLPTDGARIYGVPGDHYKVLPGF